MPEGHSIHRLARQIGDVFGGQTIAASSPQGRFADGAALLDDRRVGRAEAHGKQLFVTFEQDASGSDEPLILRVHLGLYGAFSFGGDEHFTGASSIGAPRRIGENEAAGADAGPYTGPPEPVGAVRLRLVSEHGWADLRGASACEVLTPLEAAAARAKLGPDPLAAGGGGTTAAGAAPSSSHLNASAGEADFVRRVGATRTMIGTVLMDQARVAGVGNIYRAESLFRCGIDPWAPASSLDAGTLRSLWADLVKIMHDGVRDGRIITTDPADRGAGGDLWPDQAHYVYQRAGRPCRRCSGPVGLAEVAGRKLYWCPGCQR